MRQSLVGRTWLRMFDSTDIKDGRLLPEKKKNTAANNDVKIKF